MIKRCVERSKRLQFEDRDDDGFFIVHGIGGDLSVNDIPGSDSEDLSLDNNIIEHNKSIPGTPRLKLPVTP